MAKTPPTQCQATTRDGRPCQAPPVGGGVFCFHHDPARAKERHEARRRGGLSLQYGSAGPGERVEVRLREVADLLSLLEMAAGDLLSRKPSVMRAKALAYVVSIGRPVVEASDLEQRVRALEERLNLRRLA